MKNVLFFLILFTVVACENDPAEIEAFFEGIDTSVETASEVEILYSDSAQVKVRITAPTMLRHLDKKDPYQEFIDGVFVEFYNLDKTVSSTLTAKYAIRYDNKSQVIVRDSVVWKSINREKLESEELIWEEKSQKVYTKKFVRITRPDEIIYGYGFESNQDFSYSRINAIEGRLKVEDIGDELK